MLCVKIPKRLPPLDAATGTPYEQSNPGNGQLTVRIIQRNTSTKESGLPVDCYQDDPHPAQQVLQEAVTMQPGVALTPAPKVSLNEFSASSIDFRVHFYVDVRRWRDQPDDHRQCQRRHHSGE